ncbi:helix-turn-helix domain-containing protein [Streptomyces nitrosporeus]
MIAKGLRVSVRSVQRWRQAWDEGGPRALRSQGPASPSRLGEKRFTQLEAEPAAHGWEDRRWTLGRVKTVIGRRFHPTCTVQGVRELLVRGRLSNLAFATPEHLVQRIRRGLRHIQYRSDLMDGCLAETRLAIRPS